MTNVVLIGFMGSGKSTVGHHLAERLGREFVDLDREIEADAGRAIETIFALEGEQQFREREQRALERVLQRQGVVVAAGGGAPLRDANWRLMRSKGTVVALTAEPAELARRLDGGGGRPLLQPDTKSAIASLLPERLPRYQSADLVVATDGCRPEDVAHRIAQALPMVDLDRVSIAVPAGEHEVTLGWNLRRLMASSVREMHPSGCVLLVSDPNVAAIHARPLQDALSEAGVPTALHLVPAGEAAKTLAVLDQLYAELAHVGVDRAGIVVALGGGTVGDVTGFAAATWMRGIRWVQVPTTLLAMVDSSIGGKTGVNLSAGKNLVGAVHQPAAIFTDLAYLQTLPDGDYRASLAEVIKAAIIADREFGDWLHANMAALLLRDHVAIQHAVKRAIQIKAEVVEQDPRETGIRAILNYGHTVAHALERASGYGAVRHGDAVAWGMQVAARLSVLSGRCDEVTLSYQARLLEAAGLLETRPAVSSSALADAFAHDKKARGGRPRWVLLREIGKAEYGCELEPPLVEQAVREVLRD